MSPRFVSFLAILAVVGIAVVNTRRPEVMSPCNCKKVLEKIKSSSAGTRQSGFGVIRTRLALKNLAKRVKTLEAEREETLIVLESLKANITAKRCETGEEKFRPHEQKAIVNTQDNTTTRTQKKRVTFPTPFTSVPKVSAGITLLDDDERYNTRIHLWVRNLDKSGFDFLATEFSDSLTYGVQARWIACSN